MYFNFVKQHKSLNKLIPAMAADVTDKLWEMTDVFAMIEAEEAKVSKRRGLYKMRV